MRVSAFVCDPSPHSSFEEQWGAQFGEAQERQAEADYEDDRLEEERTLFLDALFDPDFEPDLEHETDLERWTETQEPEVFE
jgi:hypothetical protein